MIHKLSIDFVDLQEKLTSESIESEDDGDRNIQAIQTTCASVQTDDSLLSFLTPPQSVPSLNVLLSTVDLLQPHLASNSLAPAISELESDQQSYQDETLHLIRTYKDERLNLLNEIRILKQALNPKTEQVYNELKKSQLHLNSIEDQLVNSEMMKDYLQVSNSSYWVELLLLDYIL